MSKLGFGAAAKSLGKQGRVTLRQMMGVAQKEFDENFETESVDGNAWDDVVRDMPPPILDVTGRLRAEVAAKGNVRVFANRATLTVDPTDDRGRGYADYHQEGYPGMPQREFMAQTDKLTEEQEEIIYLNLGKVI